MVNKEETITILKKEANYEEKITHDLANYFLKSINSCRGLSEEEKEKIDHHLKIIWSDSIKHKELFEELISYVESSIEEEY